MTPSGWLLLLRLRLLVGRDMHAPLFFHCGHSSIVFRPFILHQFLVPFKTCLLLPACAFLHFTPLLASFPMFVNHTEQPIVGFHVFWGSSAFSMAVPSTQGGRQLIQTQAMPPAPPALLALSQPWEGVRLTSPSSDLSFENCCCE